MKLRDAARLYGVPLIDYERGDDAGVLVASGAGLMMALMDVVPASFCVDADSLPASSRLEDFCICAEQLAPPLLLAGWWTIHSSEPFMRAAAAVRAASAPVEPIMLAYVGARTARIDGRQESDLSRFIEKAHGLCEAARYLNAV